MEKVLMVGCDLHDRNMLVRFACGHDEPQQATFNNDSCGRDALVKRLRAVASEVGAKRVVLVYEASGQGFGLCDFLTDRDVETHVLSPTHLPSTPKHLKQKTDSKDAQKLLECLRAHILAGNALPTVWIPPQRLRDDRELIRSRIDLADEVTALKVRIGSTIKKHGIELSASGTSNWSKGFVEWLKQRTQTMDLCVGSVLRMHLEKYEFLQQQLKQLDKCVQQLSQTERYRAASEELLKIKGVGVLTAMTFLTEIGDLDRFKNRRELAAYMGLCPSSFESGEKNDRKGHITKQGSHRLRKLLCQSAWVGVVRDPEEKAKYEQLHGGKKDRKKTAIVALMRLRGIRMWHIAKDCGVSTELKGRGGPHDLPRRPA